MSSKQTHGFMDEFKKRPVFFSLLFGGIFILAFFIYVVNFGLPEQLFATDAVITGKKKELRTLLKEYNIKIGKKEISERNEKLLISNSKNFWIFARDGNPKLKLQKIINKAASDASFNLASLSSVRSEKIADGVYIMGTSLGGEGSWKSLIHLLSLLEKQKPVLYWQSIQIYPKTLKNTDTIRVSGSVQVIAVDNEALTKLLLKK